MYKSGTVVTQTHMHQNDNDQKYRMKEKWYQRRMLAPGKL